MRSRTDTAFTLVELLVVVLILATLAAITVPALVRDDRADEFERYVRTLNQDLQRARYEAIARRDDRAIYIPLNTGLPTSYSLQAVTTSPTLTRSLLKQSEIAPEEVVIAGVLPTAAAPSSSYTPPGALPAEIRFNATGSVQLEVGSSTGTVQDGSATIFLRTADGSRSARIVVYQATGYSRIHPSW